MKKTNKVYSIILPLILILISCKNGKSEKVELVCENGFEKISLEIENGQDFLVYDKPTKTNFVCTNISPVGLVIQGPGIKLIGSMDKTTMRTEIKVPSNYLEKDTLTITVRYGDSYEKECEFFVPLKTTE